MESVKKKIPYAKPSIGNREIKYVKDAVENGWGDSCYEYIERFEREFSHVVGSPFALATSSCTGALTLGLAAMEIGEGDQVILADLNWVATLAPILHLGAKPVLVDVEEDSWCIDPERVKDAITDRTKAVIVTHLYGNVCNMDKLRAVCGNIPIIEDAAEAFGAKYNGQMVGSIGYFGVFSFHGTKTITTGEGGMLVTNDVELAAKVRILNNHGRGVRSEQFRPEMLGYKFKMSNVQAALGCAQLVRWKILAGMQVAHYLMYSGLLSGIDWIAMNQEYARIVHPSYWMTSLVFKEEGMRDRVLNALREDNIDARVFFPPLSSLPFMKDKVKVNNPVSVYLSQNGLNLPSYPDLTGDDIERICDVIKKEMGV